MTVDGQSGNRQFDLNFSGNTLRLTGGGALHDFGAGLEVHRTGISGRSIP